MFLGCLNGFAERDIDFPGKTCPNHCFYHFLWDQGSPGDFTNGRARRGGATKILTIISPIIPHFASECLEDLSLSNVQKWPKLEEKFLENDTTNYVTNVTKISTIFEDKFKK